MTYVRRAEKSLKTENLFQNSYHLGKSPSKHLNWYKQASHHSGVVELKEGDSVYVGVQGSPDSFLNLKDYETFFGLFMIS